MSNLISKLKHERIHGLIGDKFGCIRWEIQRKPELLCIIISPYNTMKDIIKYYLSQFVHLIHELIAQIFDLDFRQVLLYLKNFIYKLKDKDVIYYKTDNSL